MDGRQRTKVTVFVQCCVIVRSNDARDHWLCTKNVTGRTWSREEPSVPSPESRRACMTVSDASATHEKRYPFRAPWVSCPKNNTFTCAQGGQGDMRWRDVSVPASS